MPHPQLDRITELLWAPAAPGSSVWAILDCARDSRIYSSVTGCYQENACLYAGELPPELKQASPWLVQLDREDRFTRYLINNGWGNSWGVFLRSGVGMQQLRRHLRQFFRVKDESGKTLIFRYYDPRVLRPYLPTCRPEELKTFFGPIESYAMESESGEEVLDFHVEEKGLKAAAQSLAPVTSGTASSKQ